eukprot:6107628-Pleurochrysis_carterae.AAC.1
MCVPTGIRTPRRGPRARGRLCVSRVGWLVPALARGELERSEGQGCCCDHGQEAVRHRPRRRKRRNG